MRGEYDIAKNIDWVTIGFYALLVLLGWLNIYAVVYEPELKQSIFDLSYNSGKQFLWVLTSMVLILIILTVDYKVYSAFSYVMYAVMIVVLLITIFAGTAVNGSHSWLNLGFTKVQPAEFAKFTTAIALANYLDNTNVKFGKKSTNFTIALLLLAPCLLILLQNETGVVLVFAAFILVLYREGLNPYIPVMGIIAAILFITTLITGTKKVSIGIASVAAAIIVFLLFNLKRNSIMNQYIWKRILIITIISSLSVGFVFCVGYAFSKLKKHQKNRIMVLIDPELDVHGVGYQVMQSKIAIGSGEFWGKGYLNGTQTKFNFVPEQSTDFIFCTIGEEHGWIGSSILIVLYIGFMLRLIFLAERQKDKFARVYGYSVTCIILIHFVINIGMTLGVFPVVGIPLPFFSYGGSSLWGFTILLFVFLKLDASRNQLLRH